MSRQDGDNAVAAPHSADGKAHSGETVLQKVARFAVNVRDGNIEDDLIADARRRVADIVGIALASSQTETGKIVGKIADSRGGAEQAGVIGLDKRFPASSAALVNGTLAHALDFDDTHLPSVLHPSASVVPAALAAAQTAGTTGRDLLAAVAAGDEFVIRAGMAGYNEALGNSVFFENGMHATSIVGTLGAALAASMAFGLEEDQIGHAVAIAASMGAGIIEANRTGGTVKRVHCGWAAHAGVTAAELAAAGLTGPPTVFEGRFGFLRAYVGEHAEAEAITNALGEHWELPRVFFKPYPANHFTHAGIDAAIELRDTGLDPQEVEYIELSVPTAVLRTIAQPEADKARPTTGYAAQFSGPFTVATALVGGGGLGVSLNDFTDEAVRDPLKLELASRVRCVPDSECDAIFPNQLPAKLHVRLKNGDTREASVLYNRGGPENPLSDSELEVKFRANAGSVLPRDAVETAWKGCQELDSAQPVGKLLKTLG